MFRNIKRLLIGEPLKSEAIQGEKFNVIRGLPILASDAISSVAYAGEEILWVLVPAIGLLSYKYMFYAAISIIVLLFILVFSYRQTIDNYPNGGGAYIVAKDNLGTVPGLIAGSALSIDYILTVAVSASAGTSAITSAEPKLLAYKVIISLLLILIMTIGNLRGISESSKLFSLPTYLFIFTAIAMIIYGIIKVKLFNYVPQATSITQSAAFKDITILLFLRAFAAGCTALTGVEAVSNGIPSFIEPAQKNAKTVLLLLALVVVVIFGGISYLATLYHSVPSLDKTVISQIASQVFGNGFMFYLVQISTALILIMAANTSFSGLPLLLSVIARDGYAPRQFVKRGDRLSFSNGIILLSVSAGILTIIFRGETHYLLPLYAVGVFISFTLSQSGMAIKWVREKHTGWAHKAFINGFGAFITLITVLIIGYTKFVSGAWVVFILIPAIMYIMLQTKAHYNETAMQLSMEDKEMPEINCESVKHFIVPVEGVNKSVIKTLNYAKCLSKDIIAFHVSVDEEETEKLQKKWQQYNIDVPLVIKNSPYRSIVGPLISYINSEEHPSTCSDIVTVLIPQFIVSAWWGNILHNHTALFIKNSLLKNKKIAVITVPYIIKDKHSKWKTYQNKCDEDICNENKK
ncbi:MULTISPECIES: APC family permease [Clostridium]|uniref:APC family permease n=1 Tax=Clostridium TaxID=1485 RepID=UPI0013E98C9B|nr:MULTISPECIES: APC family permease [Clostridium]MBW9158559.1 APC family permease [Clostridium tagluense]MBZ9635199.1 APC family permease [Clostridium sp. FP1]WLC63706.1 APC family permease [Clostridium tagluense]